MKGVVTVGQGGDLRCKFLRDGGGGGVRNMIEVFPCHCGKPRYSQLFQALNFLIWNSSRNTHTHAHTPPLHNGVLVLWRTLLFQRAPAGFPHRTTLSACTVIKVICFMSAASFCPCCSPAFFPFSALFPHVLACSVRRGPFRF